MPIGQSMAGLFGKNPINHLRKHYDLVHECCKKLPEFIEASTKNDWQKAQAVQQAIAELESKADDFKAELYLSLPKRLFTAVPREDLVNMVNLQDKVANKSKDIAGLMLGRQMQIPQAIQGEFDAFMDTALATVAQAHLAIEELDDLVESGFGGHESRFLEELITKLDDLEHQNDKAQITVRSSLFAIEKDLNPVDAIFLYRIIDYVGELADRAQKLGGQLMQMIAR